MTSKAKSLFVDFPVSLVIGFLIVVSFFWLSGFSGFIPVGVQKSLSFNVFVHPFNAVFFLLVHTGVGHLVANFSLIVLSGWLLEQSGIPKRHVVGLFLMCGIFSMVLFNGIEPSFAGIGASGGAVGLLTASLVLNPREGLSRMVAALVLVLVVVVVWSYVDAGIESGLWSQKASIEQALEQAILTNDSAAIAQKQSELVVVSSIIEEKAASRVFERQIQIANTVHLIASVLAVVYLFVFLRPIVKLRLHENAVFLSKGLSLRKSSGR